MKTAFELKPNELGQVPLGLIDPDPDQPRKTFDEGYIDEHYLAAQTEAELTALLDSIDLGPVALAERYNYETAGRVDQYALDIREEFGVPAEIRFAYEQMTKGDDDDA